MNLLFNILATSTTPHFTSTRRHVMDELFICSGGFDRCTRQAIHVLMPAFAANDPLTEPPTKIVPPIPTDVPVPEPFDIPVPEPMDVPPPNVHDVPPPNPPQPEFNPQPKPRPVP